MIIKAMPLIDRSHRVVIHFIYIIYINVFKSFSLPVTIPPVVPDPSQSQVNLAELTSQLMEESSQGLPQDNFQCDNTNGTCVSFHSSCDNIHANPECNNILSTFHEQSSTDCITQSEGVCESLGRTISNCDKHAVEQHIDMLESNSSRDSGLCSDVSDQKGSMDINTGTDLHIDEMQTGEGVEEDEFLAFQDASSDVVIESEAASQEYVNQLESVEQRSTCDDESRASDMVSSTHIENM